MLRLAIHGGAGELDADHVNTRAERDALQRIAAEGWQRLQAGDPALDVAELLVLRLEQCPLFNAGVGAVLSSDGQPELDAGIMDGRDRRYGAVAGVTRAKSPVRLARAVMERTAQTFYAGAGADRLNAELGLDCVTPDYFVIPLRQQQLREAQARGVVTLDHDHSSPHGNDSAGFGTVGAVVRDARGHLAAATSTGGMTNKPPGRVGDTPIPGAGTFADDRSAAVSCTGTGESFMRAGFGFAIDAALRYRGLTLAQACDEALDIVRQYGGRGGCIAIDRDGEIHLAFNAQAMFRAWIGADGQLQVGVG